MTKRKRIGLALSGGVVRGMAHVGVLTALSRAGIPIDCVAGVSAGALVGAAYCAGIELAQIREMALQMRWRKIASPTWPWRGLLSFEKMERWWASLTGDPTFADLKLPFAVVASDLKKGLPVVLRQGRVGLAVRAASSVPGFVPPVELDGMLLGDGGVTNNLPVAVLREMGADYVIGVDVFAPSIRRRWGALGLGFAAIEIMVQNSGGGPAKADCLIRPKLAGYTYFCFSKSRELMAMGEQATEEKLPPIQAAVNG